MLPTQHFQTILLADEDGGSAATGIQIPFDVPGVWGTRGRIAVRGTINGAPFRSSIMRMGGNHMMTVNATMRAEAGIKAGDLLDVVMEPDDEPRTVTVPADLQAALAGNPAAQAGWERLAYTRRKELARDLDAAQKPETRARRLEKFLAELAGAWSAGNRSTAPLHGGGPEHLEA